MSKAELVYLASPYAHPDERIREARYRAAMHFVAESMLAPVPRRWDVVHRVFYSPIVHNHPLALIYPTPTAWEFWRAIDFPMLERCDRLVVLRLEGWDRSVGVQAEVEHARSLGKPVHHVDDWVDFRSEPCPS